MKYALIIFTHVYAGSSGFSIPMQTMDLCQQAAKTMTQKYKPPTFTGATAIVAADCIQVAE